MHTPRFSGQPISAGDLVFVVIPSLPIRTSCENVGTVIPLFRSAKFSVISFKFDRFIAYYLKLTTKSFARADKLHSLSPRALTKTREHTHTPKGVLRIRRDQQETPHALQEGELRSWFRIGEAHSAFRGWRPIPAALLSHSIDLVPGPKNSHQTNHPPLILNGCYCSGKIPLNKHKV